MPRIVIIGNSAAGFSCCDTLLKSSLGLEITVISQEEYPAYKKNLLIAYLAGNIKEEELYLCPLDYYERNKVNFLKDAKVTKLDIKKNIVTLKDNTKINYDYLVIASGQKANVADIPGQSKEGVFAFDDLTGAKKIKQRLMIANTVCIAGDAYLSLCLWQAIAKTDKEIKIIASPKPESFTQTEKAEWIDNLEIKELIGDGAELMALKLSNGKVIEAPLVIYLGNYTVSTNFLKDTEIKANRGYIITDEFMRTNFENILACGSVRQEKTWEEAVREGALTATSIINILERGKTICQQMC